MTWTKHQLDILETTVRVSSIFSLLGAGFIIITFCASPSFHKPINRLAFFASFGNILTNVATLISQDGIRSYESDQNSGLCKMQSFFIQWLMVADVLFCAAMALNVYLTVFLKFSSHRLQKLELPYILFCYGAPFIPPLAILFINKKLENGSITPVMGPATLWCWISDEWQILRIALFYGPVWVLLFFTFGIYVLAGHVIFKLRSSLRGFARDSSVTTTGNFGSGVGTVTSIPQQTGTPPPVTGGTKTTVVTQTTQGISDVPILSDPSPVAGAVGASTTGYSCTVGTGYVAPVNGQHPSTMRHKSAVEANTAAWAYCRCAMLFFLALVITWLPSSINRVYTVVHPGATNFSLHVASALVLPCQGFWNGVIYVITTLPACREFFWTIYNRMRALVGKEPINWRRRRHPHHHGKPVIHDMDRKPPMGGSDRERHMAEMGMGLGDELSSLESVVERGMSAGVGSDSSRTLRSEGRVCEY